MSTRAPSDAAERPQRWSKNSPAIDWTITKRTGLGVDWITGVTTSVASSAELSTWTKRIYRWELAAGGIEKGWGCSGFTGFKVGEMEMGIRGDECMVRLMSDCSRLHWRKVYRWSDNVTRLDLQVTYDIGADPQPVVWKFFHEANKHSAKLKRGPKNTVDLGSDGGATVYCGRRTSNVFGRCYARGPKTKLDHDKNNLRFEVQFNKRLAGLVARELATVRNQDSYIAGRVVQFFRARGLSLPERTEHVPNICLPRSRSDLEKRLLWLEKSVRQSCMMLAERGRLDDLIAALGIEAFVKTRR